MGVSPGAARPTTAPLPGLARGCRRRRSATGSRWAASANSRVGAGKALTALVLHKHCLSIKQATSIVPAPAAFSHSPATPTCQAAGELQRAQRGGIDHAVREMHAQLLRPLHQRVHAVLSLALQVHAVPARG